MNPDFDEPYRHRKKSSMRPPKKTDHKHVYKPCIFEYRSIKLDKVHGFISGPAKYRIGSYCDICGKVGPGDSRLFWQSWDSVEAVRQSNPEVRTLPIFHLDDVFSKDCRPR